MTIPYNIHKRYHRYLHEGIKTDAVSGWLLYVSFYYVTRQYEVTLKLTDYVLSIITPNKVFINGGFITTEKFNTYRTLAHSTMTLNERMKLFTVKKVMYIQHSSLIPEELQVG